MTARLPQFLEPRGVNAEAAIRAAGWLRCRGYADARELAAFFRDTLGLSRGQGYQAAVVLRDLPGVHYTRVPYGMGFYRWAP